MPHLLSAEARQVGLEAALCERFGWTLAELDAAPYERVVNIIYYMAQKDAAEEQAARSAGRDRARGHRP